MESWNERRPDYSVYKEYFGLKDLPFSIAPDPNYLYMSDKHCEALAHLIYGIRTEGAFILLTGEVGAGKTTICRCMLDQLPENCDSAFIINPRLTDIELLASICEELGIKYPAGASSVKIFVDLINERLLQSHASDRRTLLIIDEAQNLSAAVLEQLRLLTNLETNRAKLLQIVLIGQPELRDILNKTDLRQLSQRITARFHLEPLSLKETSDYIKHRLAIAGSQRNLFPQSVIRRLFRRSKGVPRIINLICDRALLGVYAQGRDTVDKKTLDIAAAEALGQTRPPGLFKKLGLWLKRRSYSGVTG
jgi:general secretion pathway protein A